MYKRQPRFVRITSDMPLTANNKVNKQPLRAVGWHTSEPVWWQPARGDAYRLFTADDEAALAAEFAEHGRTEHLPH